MDERELEQRLRTAVEHAAPDPLDRILAACGPQAGTVLPFEAPKKKRRWAPLAVAAALVVMCCGAFGISSWRGANAVDSVVMLDVNPSLSMIVSSKERVLSVTVWLRTAPSREPPWKTLLMVSVRCCWSWADFAASWFSTDTRMAFWISLR